MYKSSWLSILVKNHFNFDDRPIDQYVIFECKYLFSIIIFNFVKSENCQDRMHTHAFNSLSIKLKGSYEEHIYNEQMQRIIVERKNVFKFFERDIFHAIGRSKTNCWTILLAGPWKSSLKEFNFADKIVQTLSLSRPEQRLAF